MDYFFLDDFKKLTVTCPPRHYKPFIEDKMVFRWIFDNLNNENNFKPRFYLVPKKELEKINNIKNPTQRDTRICSMLALSMFVTEKQAYERFKDIEDDMGDKIFDRLGTKIASGIITKNDGVNGDFDDFGHFNHHPVKNNNYSQRFQIISNLR